MVVVVGEWRASRRHPRDLPGVQNEHDTRGAHPRPRVHCRVVRPLRSWYTRFVTLDQYSLNGGVSMPQCPLRAPRLACINRI